MKKFHILFAIAFSFASYFSLFGQVLNFARYGNNAFNNAHPSTCSDISSDFGPRNPGQQGTLFHRGVDFKPIGDQDIVILAPFDGQITGIDRSPRFFIRLFIDSHAGSRVLFLHIFNNNALPVMYNGFELRRVQGQLVIIDLVNCRAFCETTTPLTVDCNGQQINTTNTFQSGWPLAPMGNSGLDSRGNPYPYHLHLSQLESGSFDDGDDDESVDPMHDIRTSTNFQPFSLRLRRRNPTPGINLNCNNNCEQSNILGAWHSFTPTYTDNTRNIAQIELAIAGAQHPLGELDRYSNGFMNESIINLNIRKTNNGTFAPFVGSQNLAAFRIDPRGNNSISPINIKNTIYGNLTEGGAGCAPYAYTSDVGFQPYDYFIVPDLFMRIHKGHQPKVGSNVKLAQYPWDAKYYDGNYELQAQSINLDGQTHVSQGVNFSIDNFNPFVYGAKAHFSEGPSGQAVYERYWGPVTKGKISLRLRTSRQVPDPQNPGNLTLRALSSEAMTSMKARIPGPFPTWVNGTKESTDNLGRESWKFEMGSSGNLAPNTCYRIEFDGNDLAGNRILNYELEALCAKNTLTKTLPYRNGATSWANPHAQGEDKVHFINLSQCGESGTGECIDGEEISSSIIYANSGQSNGGVKLTLEHAHPNATFKWTDANENVVATTQSLSNVAAGLYCVEIKEECCNVSGCYEIGTCTLDATTQVKHPTISQNDGTITLNVSGGTEDYRYNWSTGSTAASLANLSPGTYTVTVSDFFHCSVVKTMTLISCNLMEVSASPLSTVPSACDANDGSLRLMSPPNITGGVGPFTWLWKDDQGNNHIPDVFGRISNLRAGIYTLVVTDSRGCTGTTTHELVAENMPIIVHQSSPSCVGIDNGTLTIALVPPEGIVYDIVFDNGEEFYGVTEVELIGLPAGHLCAHFVASGGGCEFDRCFTIGELPAPNLQLTEQITHNCPGRNNGSITLNLTGSNAYSVKWSDDIFANTLTRNNLFSGAYCATVTDLACGVTAEKCVELKQMALSIQSIPGCTDEGQILAHVQFGTPPYTYKWTYPHTSTTASINNVKNGIYCVTATDARGCSSSACVNMINWGVYIKEIKGACISNSFTGSVKLEVRQPNHGNNYHPVRIDGVVVSQFTLDTVYTITVGNLQPGKHILSIDWECNGSGKEFSIPTEGDRRTFDHYDKENNLCVWDVYCGDSLIVDQGVKTVPFLDVDNAQQRPCRTPQFCGIQEVDPLDGETKTVRAMEYSLIINAAQGRGFRNV